MNMNIILRRAVTDKIFLIKYLYYTNADLMLPSLSITTRLIVLLNLLLACTSIRPTLPIQANPNTESSPSNFMFSFQLMQSLPTNGYLMITFSTFTSTVTPISCDVLNNLLLSTVMCVNLNTAGAALSISQINVNAINPNLNAAKTVVMAFSATLSANTTYRIQIRASNVLPNIGRITKSFEMYTITSTGVMMEENWNFGQTYLEPKQNVDLSVVSRNPMVSNLPGRSFTGLIFEITIGVATPTPNARLKFVIEGGFIFTDASIVATQGLVGVAPIIVSSVLVSPNVIITTFSQSFPIGRKFTLTIADYKCPMSISSGYISVYHLATNSLSPLQISQHNIAIQTIPFTPSLQLLTIDGTTPAKPIQFYTSTTQYINMKIVVPRDIDAGFVIQIVVDTLVIHEGSVYAKTSTVNAPTLGYEYIYNGGCNGVKITGFPLIPESSTITITMRVEIPSNPIFTFTVSIDTSNNLNSPIIQGSITSNSASIPDSYISLLTGSENEPNKISWMQTTDSSISFTVNPLFPTNAGSSLKLITSNNLIPSSNFLSSASCLVSGSAQPCTITSDLTFTTIIISSNSSYNLYPQATPTTITINSLTFQQASTHSSFPYHFYFSLIVSQAVNANQKCQLLVPAVIPQRNRLSGLSNYFSNNINNTGTNFPNVLRIVNTNLAEWVFVVQAWEKRIISVFAYEGWANLLQPNNGDPYPAASNLNGLTYTYWKGTSSSNSLDFPLDWDRVDIILDGSETSTPFSIILPTTFVSSSVDLHFEIMVGVYNTIQRDIQYKYIEPRPVDGQVPASPTYIKPAVASLTAKPKMVGNKIQLAGNSGSYKSNVNVTITPGTGTTYSGTTYSSCLIVVSDWNWFDSTTALGSSSLSSANPLFGNVQQTPKSIYITRIKKYLTYIPLKTAYTTNTQFLIYFNNVKLPYSDDLPYYSIYLVDDTGAINCYNQFINQDKSVFYFSYLKNLDFSCNDISLGVANTYCTIQFNTNQDIQIGSTFTVTFTGMQISTNSCSMQLNLPLTTIPLTCSSNTDKNQLSIVLSNTARLPANGQYQILMSGVSIMSNTIVQNIVIELRDPTSSYIIEKGTKILITSVEEFNPIYVDEVKYSKNNPIVCSTFSIKFRLPRPLNNDEQLALVLNKDLSNLNTIQSKLRIFLYDPTNASIPVTWSMNLRNYQIIFEGLVSTLQANAYRLEINGLRTPSTIEQDLINIIYVRIFDSSFTIFNNAQSTTVFPQLSDKINSMITMTPFFNTQGLEQQLTFSITNTYGSVNQNTQWIINLPRYYSQEIWNENYMIYCTISDVPITCALDAATPYQIKVSNSPRVIDLGAVYSLKVFGLVCPRAVYLNGNALYVTESIFLGVSDNSTSPSYTEYSELFLTDTVIDPETAVNYGTITVVGVQSSNMEVLQSTFFTVNLTCNQPIAQNQWIYLTFPAEFDNFHDLPLVVEVVQGAIDKTYPSEVVNRRIGFQLTNNSLVANILISIKISSLPNPTTPASVDMNKLKVMATSSNRMITTAASLQLHNLVQSMTFIPSSLHIVINNYQTIPITAGTFSGPILIQASNFAPFVSNMKISFVSDALSFVGSPAYMYLGETSSTFSVGADQSLIPTVYPFDIIKTQASISAFYESLTKYTVMVSNIPVTIAMPATFTVPVGGCSVPYQVTLPNAPYSDVNINFEYDTTLFNLHLFWVNEEISYNELMFDMTITKRWLSFCVDPSSNISSVAVRVFLGGTNYQAYQLANSLITVNIIANTTTITPQPAFNLTSKNLQKTYAGFEVVANVNGQIYFEIMLTGTASFLDVVSLKALVKEYDLLLESQADFLNYTYQADRYRRIGLRQVATGVNILDFSDLSPGLSYNLCVYFENQHRVMAAQKCTTFLTMAWGTISRAIITFNPTLYESQLNKVLCYLVKSAESKINQVVDLEGRSCSLSNAPENYNYQFNGTTITSELSQTMIYFVTNRNLTADPSVAKFAANYDSNGITAASLSKALSTFAITYISSSYQKGSFNPPDIIGKANAFTPVFSSGQPVFDANAGTITIPNVALDKAGSVYMILTFSRKITYNKITGNSDIDMRPAITPPSGNLLNCMDGYNDSPLKCYQIFLLGGASKAISFPNVSINSLYVVYYAVANEYPLRPVIVSQVKNFTILTTFQVGVQVVLWVVLCAVLTL